MKPGLIWTQIKTVCCSHSDWRISPPYSVYLASFLHSRVLHHPPSSTSHAMHEQTDFLFVFSYIVKALLPPPLHSISLWISVWINPHVIDTQLSTSHFHLLKVMKCHNAFPHGTHVFCLSFIFSLILFCLPLFTPTPHSFPMLMSSLSPPALSPSLTPHPDLHILIKQHISGLAPGHVVPNTSIIRTNINLLNIKGPQRILFCSTIQSLLNLSKYYVFTAGSSI